MEIKQNALITGSLNPEFIPVPHLMGRKARTSPGKVIAINRRYSSRLPNVARATTEANPPTNPPTLSTAQEQDYPSARTEELGANSGVHPAPHDTRRHLREGRTWISSRPEVEPWRCRTVARWPATGGELASQRCLWDGSRPRP